MRVQKSDPRKDASSAEQSRGQRMRFAIKSNVLDNSNVKDKYQEGTGQRKAVKYLRESYYHHIKCSATHFLVAFMWRRPLNNTTLAAPTHRRSKRVSDGTNTQVVAWTINKWRAKVI